MHPASIKSLLIESQDLYADALNSNKFIIPSFLSSWVAWEALRTRFIRVLIHHRGWKLKDSERVLARKKISSMIAAEAVIVSLGLSNPHHWPKNSARAWKLLIEIEPMRHRLIHGFSSIDPKRIMAATRLLLLLVSDHQWLSELVIINAPKRKDRIIVGSLLSARRSCAVNQNRSIEDLAAVMGVDLSQGSKRLPSLEKLESIIRAHEKNENWNI